MFMGLLITWFTFNYKQPINEVVLELARTITAAYKKNCCRTYWNAAAREGRLHNESEFTNFIAQAIVESKVDVRQLFDLLKCGCKLF